MNEYMAEKIARALESIAKSLTGIEAELKKQNELLEPLSDCVDVSLDAGNNRFQTNNFTIDNRY